jgi:hypothetical protein
MLEGLQRIENSSNNAFDLLRKIYIFFLFRLLVWVLLVRRPLTDLLYQTRITNEYISFGGMRIGKGNDGALSLCPPQMPHDLTWIRNRTAAVGSMWLTA